VKSSSSLMALNDRTGASVRCTLVGKVLVEHDVVMSRTGLVACANGTGGTVLASEGDSEGMVLSQSRSSLHWASAVWGSLLMPVLVLLPMLHDEPSSILMFLPPGSYANLLLSLVPKPLALYGWLLQLWL